MLTMEQEHKAFFEDQKHDREHLLAVGVAWEMLSKKPKINDVVYLPDLHGKVHKSRVVKVGDNLIDVAAPVGSIAYEYTSLAYNKDTGEYYVITDEEAIRRGYRRWGDR